MSVETDPDDFLPTPRRAMRMAVEAASNGDFDRTRAWVLIAHELRTGTRPATADASVPFVPRMLERDESPTPLDRHAAYEAATKCGNCGHVIELRLAMDVASPDPATWIHTMTRQAVCPVSAPDQTHTFAVPRLDDRE